MILQDCGFKSLSAHERGSKEPLFLLYLIFHMSRYTPPLEVVQ